MIIKNIKQNADGCRKLVDGCKKLASLKITNNSDYWNRLNIMTMVIRVKESLKIFKVDHSLADWTPAAICNVQA